MLINGQGDKKPRYSKPRFLSWPNSTLLHWPGTRVNSKTHAHSPHNWPTQWLYPTDPLRTQNWKHFRVLSAPFLAEGMGMLCGNWGGERIQSGVTTLFLYRWWLSMQGESVVTAITLLCMRLWGTTLHVGGGRGSVHLLRVMVSKALPCPPPATVWASWNWPLRYREPVLATLLTTSHHALCVRNPFLSYCFVSSTPTEKWGNILFLSLLWPQRALGPNSQPHVVHGGDLKDWVL